MTNIFSTKSVVVKLSSDISSGCKYCSEFEAFNKGIDEVANHYIDKHGFDLLHIGQESSNDNDGKPWQSTIIMLGK